MKLILESLFTYKGLALYSVAFVLFVLWPISLVIRYQKRGGMKKWPRILVWILIALFVIGVLAIVLLGQIYPPSPGPEPNLSPEPAIIPEVSIEINQATFKPSETLLLTLNNTLSGSIWIESNDCAEEPFDLLKYKEGTWEQIHFTSKLICDPPPPFLEIKSGDTYSYNFEYWMGFFAPGKYKIRVVYSENEPREGKLENPQEVFSPEFTIKDLFDV